MPTESPYPHLEIPNLDIWTLLFSNKNRQFPNNHKILVDPYTSRFYTYGQIREKAASFGAGLRAQYSFARNDVICLFSPNHIDFPCVIWGTHWAGGVVSPANCGYSADELAFQLKDCGARILITTSDLYKSVGRVAAEKCGITPENVILIGYERDPEGRLKHWSSVRSLSGASQRYRRVRVDPDKDLAFLVYSSGTTGLPKGVMLSHRNIVANVLQVDAVEKIMLTAKDKIMAFLPFFHIYGLTTILHQSLFRGYQLVVMPRFDLEDFCRFVQKHRVTFAYIAPPVAVKLSKDPIVDKYDLSSIRMLNSGAAPLTRDLVDSVYARKKIKLKQGYGLSELSPTTHSQTWAEWHSTVGSVGKLLPAMTAKYMSPEGEELEVGQAGELWLAGPNVFKGYLNNPEGTKNALTPDGYFKTGDVGYQDAEGNLFITDRVKELIKYKGFQVAPAELEGYLLGHDKVVDVAVIGIYRDDIATEVPRAYIVPRPGSAAGPELEKEIVDWLAARLANHKRLRGGVRFIDVIPKSMSGKILRRVLKDRAADEERRVKAKL